MKKKILALILSVQMLLSVITPSMFVMAETFNSNTEEQQSDATGGKSVTTTSIFPECELKWTSYVDYLMNQAKTAWNSPEYYVGYEVEFMPYYTSIDCVSGFTGNDSRAYVSIVSSDANSIRADNTVDPSTFKMVIDGYHFEENNGVLWYKIKAAEGYELPEVLQQNPYVFHLNGYTLDDIKSTPPALVIGPVRAIFNTTTGSVNVKRQPVAASQWNTVDVSKLSPIFHAAPSYYSDETRYYPIFAWDHYDIGDLAADYTEFNYVEQESVILIPAEASAAYEKLLAAEDTYEYYKIIAETPTSVLAQFSEHHRKELDKCIEALSALEQVRKETTVDFGGVSLPIYVVGKLPNDATLQASVVSNETVVSNGFDVKEDLSDLIVALDIKLINSDGTEWQPKEGRRVAVSIGLSALGYVDGSVVRLQHQHDGFIEDFEITVVQNGALTVYTSGFSIYAVSRVDEKKQSGAGAINNNGMVTLEIAKNTNNEYIFYFTGSNRTRGTWSVKDATGALHYTVHTSSSPDPVGNNGVYAPWITIHPLKESLSTDDKDPNTIKLSFSYSNGNNVDTETYTVKVIAPKASAAEHGGRKLYIKDLVNTSGKIVAALTDTNGDEIKDGLAGAAFEWTRSDNYLINLSAYDTKDNYSSVNIAIDHSGLVEARKVDGKFVPTTYTLKAILSDGDELTAEYTVYYQSEIINADFEFPTTSKSSYYAFFPNGWPELHWKTTAPGTDGNLTKDVEYGLPEASGADVGVPRAAHGYTMAEINAEAFGALYQDVISVPGEDIVWNFAHAARVTSWARDISNAMFIVLGPTEAAQTLDADQLIELGNTAKAAAGANNTSFLNGKTSVEVEYRGAKYQVWYHKAEAPNNYNAANNYGWTDLEGTYKVPDGQYRTRLFFMSEKGNSNPNAGNLIDQAKGGMYKKYVIQYYSEKLDSDNKEVQELLTEVKGEALLHSSVALGELKRYMSEGKYLHKILINGGNYPYNVKYEGDASLYVEKYNDANGFNSSTFVDKEGVGEYDIVMLIYLRDVAISVQTQLVFPDKMTDAQKLSVVQAESGYQTTVELKNKDGSQSDSGTASIKNRDPKGGYTGYYYFKEEIYLSKNVAYSISQTSVTTMPGLKLVSTKYYTTYYKQGVAGKPIESETPPDITLGDKTGGFAEIVVVNTYEETMTTIYYKAVGNGKVAFNDQQGDLEFSDIPTEKLGYYTAKARGAKVLCGDGATFKGWYKDEACTQLVTDADGVWNDKDNSFTPNANIISTDAITFYAKFETGTLVIERKNAAPGQSFVYCIESKSGNLKMYVTLKCDENGNGKVEISEVAAGEYTVTELEDWSWRHEGQEQTKKHEDGKKELKFEFSNSANNKWINGYA